MSGRHTVHIGVRILDVDYEWCTRLAHATGHTVSDTVRDAITTYRALMSMHGVEIFKSLPELRGQLVAAYEAGAVMDPNGPRPAEKPKPKRARTRIH